MVRILVVDDNRDLAENLAEILQDAGYDTDTFDDPREALDAVAPGRYGLCLLDIRMPRMDGVDLLRAIRHRDPAVSALAMTAFSRDERVRDAIDEGASAVLAKPVDPGMLLEKLFKTLHR